MRPRSIALAAALACLHAATSAEEAVAAAAPESPASAPDAVLAPVTVDGMRKGYAHEPTAVSAGVLGSLPILDSPFSINVITRRLLDNQQATTYGDFLKNDPSATVGNVPVGFATLRGFSVNSDGYLFDGLAGNVALSDGRWQLENVEQIEVLKGPSAFLYGLGASTSLGGTINFRPKQPQADPVRSFTAGYTTRSLYSVTADLGDRFGGERQFGWRLNLGWKDGEQAVDHYDWSHHVATLAVDWHVTGDLIVTGGYEYARNRYPRLQPFYFPGPGVTAVPDAPDASRGMAQPWDDFITIGQDAYLHADWQLSPDWSLTAQALTSSDARPQTKEARFGSIDAAGNSVLFASEDVSRTTGSAAQVLVHGKVDVAGIANQLTLGATATRGASRSGSTFLGVFPSNIYSPVDGPEPASMGPVTAPTTQKTHTASVLLSDILKFDDRWSVLLGARHAQLTVDNLDGQPIKASKTTPTGALMFKPIGNALVYLNYSEGLEQGGKAPVGSANQGNVLAPIKTTQVELGGKLEVAALTVTTAVFDLKKPFEYVDAATTTYVQNGVQRHRGAEVNVSGSLRPGLEVVAGAMFLDPATTHTGNPATEGKRPVGVPSVTGNLYLDWQLARLPGLSLNGGVYHAGKQYLDTVNSLAIKAWTRFDVGARYETRLDNVDTAFLLGIENVGNKNYWAGAQSGILTIAEPRTLKLTARFDL